MLTVGFRSSFLEASSENYANHPNNKHFQVFNQKNKKQFQFMQPIHVHMERENNNK